MEGEGGAMLRMRQASERVRPVGIVSGWTISWKDESKVDRTLGVAGM